MLVYQNTEQGELTDLIIKGSDDELRDIALAFVDAIATGEVNLTITTGGRRANIAIILSDPE